jgi:phosphoglycerate kinase
MKYLSENKIENKKIILRCDFNVPVNDGVILDNSKIIKSLETINYLLANNNELFLLSHFGRVKKEEDKNKNSLNIVYKELCNYIDLDFVDNPLNIEDTIKNSTKKCHLIENTRFTDLPEKKESANDLDLAKYWASFGDIFVIDAFASMHRVHSSIAGISNYLPTYIGFLAEKELNNLREIVNNQIHPFTVIMGGAKPDDKIKVIEKLLEKCDKLIITGGILNTFLKVFGHNIGNSIASDDEEVLNNVKNILDKYKEKIYFSNNFIVLRNDNVISMNINDIQDNDIIFDNILDILNILNNSKIIFLNGTCGKYEDSNYEKGTLKLLKDLSDCAAKVYAGGGDTLSAINKFGFQDSYYYLSSGGGATLEYLANGTLKAIEYIEEHNNQG